jgi:uncharacterized protein (DUF58 family)
MIVPQTRLLIWSALVVLPFSFLGGAEPVAAWLSFVILGLFAVLAIADALAARRALAGVGVELPPLVRMSKDRETGLEVRVKNARQRVKTLRLALVLPPEVRSPQETASVSLPAGQEWSRFSWSCRPARRGRYRLDSARIETSSPLGFWGARRTLSTRSELRVYPNLRNERRDLAALFLHRGSFGLHAQRQLGKGREFEKLREYIPGDGFDEIHWKTTAKRGRPITKVFQIERTQEIYVVLDASRLSGRVSGSPASTKRDTTIASPSSTSPEREGALPLASGETTLERFITAALALGLAAEQQGDFFGLVTFSNRVLDFIRARNGHAHYSICRDALYRLEPEPVTPDFDELCTLIRLWLRRRALLFFLTSLDDPVVSESFVRNLDLIRRQHLVLVNMLPSPGVGPAFSDAQVETVDDIYQRLGGHLLWQNLRELEKVLQRRGVAFNLLKNERLSAQLVAQYLNIKRRQLL